MEHLLTAPQRARYDDFRTYVDRCVIPCAGAWDQAQAIPACVLADVAARGYLGAAVPAVHGGSGWDAVTLGLLHEAFGRGSAALADVLTVQTMVSSVLVKWGTAEQKRTWLPRLASGEAVGAFALTEPTGGSALDAMDTEMTPRGDALVITGTKTWISAAQQATIFLVFGRLGSRPAACLVPRSAPGLSIEPITDLLGFRAAGLGTLNLHRVEVPGEDVVGRPGFALSHVAPLGLHVGRIGTACSSLGLLRGCFEESAARARSRRVGTRTVGEFGMIRSLLAGMGTDLAAAGALCHAACRAEGEHRPDAFRDALMAKYFAARAAVRAASNAVQIAGAAGCHASSAVSRFYRDAKILEIVEGTTQIHEDLLGQMFVGRGSAAPVAAEAW